MSFARYFVHRSICYIAAHHRSLHKNAQCLLLTFWVYEHCHSITSMGTSHLGYGLVSSLVGSETDCIW